jgi:hypothetical protein
MRLLLFSIFLYVAVVCQVPQRQYVIEEDYFRGPKAREFSVYYPRRANLHYRIESSLSFRQSIRLVAYPPKKTIAKLKSSKKNGLYQANLKLLDLSTKKWTAGLIQQEYRLLGQHWAITWNGSNMSMTMEPASLTTSFHDDQQNRALLAKFRIRAQSLVWLNVYDMEVYSNSTPDSIYLLSLAVKDHASQWGGKN